MKQSPSLEHYCVEYGVLIIYKICSCFQENCVGEED